MSCDASADNITLDYYLGDTAPIVAVLTDPDTGGAYNLTGCAITFTVKAALTDPDSSALLRKTTGAGISILDAAAGRLAIYPGAAETAALSPDRHYYLDLIVRDAAGYIVTTVTGYLHTLARATLTPA